MQSGKQRVHLITAIWRVIKLIYHFTVGAIRLFLLGRYYDESKKEMIFHQWSCKCLKLLDIQLIIEGKAPKDLENTLLVANHISWLDILIIFNTLKPKFVAKKEIANWPVLGVLAKLSGTIFLERENKRHIIEVNDQLAKALQAGSCIAVFPEGRTSSGLSVDPFKSSLFDSVYRSKGNVFPVVLQYLDCSKAITTRPSYVGQMSLLRSVWNVITCYKLTVKVIFEEVLDSQLFLERGDLAAASQKKIIQHW